MDKIALCIKELAWQTWYLVFDLWNPHKGGRTELTSQNCALVSTKVALNVCPMMCLHLQTQ